jgi:hypothetical protein
MGFALDGSYVWGWNYDAMRSPAMHSDNQHERHGDRPASPADAEPKGSASAPFFVQAIPAPKPAEERAQEAEDREEKKHADRWLVRWTFALFAATIG